MKRKKDRKPKIVIKTRNGGYTKLKCFKNGFPVIENNELVKEKHIVRI